MPNYPTAEIFVEKWELADSPEDVSSGLLESGYRKMNVSAVLRWAKTFREVGIHLKKMKAPDPPIVRDLLSEVLKN